MQSEDLKLFALFYIKEDEVLTDKEKIQLMDFVGESNDEDVIFLLATGQMPGETVLTMREAGGQAFRIDESLTAQAVARGVDLAISGMDAKDVIKSGFHAAKAVFQTRKTVRMIKGPIPGRENPWGSTTMYLGGTAAGALAASMAYKLSKKHMARMQIQCDKEKGQAKKVCYNKIKRDSFRVEILSLSSMKIKCRKTKNSEKCIKNIDKRIKELQDRMDSIKVF